MILAWGAAWLLFIVVMLLLGHFGRHFLFHYKVFGGQRMVSVASYLDAKLHYLGIGYFTLLFLGNVAVVYLAFQMTQPTGQTDANGLLEGIVLGFITVNFVAGQLPRLQKPHIYAVFLPSLDGRSYQDRPAKTVDVEAGKNVTLFVRLTNLGLNYYKNCTCWLYSVPPKFNPLPYDPAFFSEVDFAKEYEVQRQNKCVVFASRKIALGVAPGNHIVFPARFQAPPTPGQYKFTLLFTCEDRWGETGYTGLRAKVIPATKHNGEDS